MIRRSTVLLGITAVLATALAGCVSDAPHEEPAHPTGATSYAPLLASPIRGLTLEEIDAYATGKGASLALPAELNGYPGPAHVLDLAEKLELTAEQRHKMVELRDAMRADAIARGEELLVLYKALDDGFRNDTLDESALGDLLEKIGQKDAELRFVHLSTHFEAAEILTPHQKALYVDLRGYGSGDHSTHTH